MLAVLGGVIVFAVVIGSAATLNGLGGTNLGADYEDVVSCDTDGVTVSYETAHSAAGFVVTGVTLSGVNDANCDGQVVDVDIHDNSDASIDEGSTTASGTSFTVSLTGGDQLAEDVYGVAVVISG